MYIRLPGVDVDRFAESMQGGGLLSYIDALSGGSISRVGIFSLGKLLMKPRRKAFCGRSRVYILIYAWILSGGFLAAIRNNVYQHRV